MQFMHKTKRTIILVALALSVTSCVNKELKVAQSFASERAEMLDRVVPVNMNGYNLIRAKSINEQIELTLLYSGEEAVQTPGVLAKNLTEAYCINDEIRSFLTQGVRYKLFFRDARGRPIHQHHVTQEICQDSL